MKRFSVGITIFASVFIITSLAQIIKLLDVDNYAWLFQALPEKIFLFRYLVSWSLRMLGLACGIGIIFRKNLFRKIALILCSFTVVTIYWKHPFLEVSKHAAKIIDEVYAISGVSGLLEPSLIKLVVIASFIGLNVIDFGFALCILYYFTRADIKAQFE